MAAALAGDEAVGQIPWERYAVDPTPGPVPPDALRDAAKAGEGLYLATPRSYVERGQNRLHKLVKFATNHLRRGGC